MSQPVELPNTRIITISGRIGSGSTTLAKKLSQTLDWKHIEGGEIFWDAIRKKTGLLAKDTNLRPDEEDLLFDTELKRILLEEENVVLETKLAGFNAQEIPNIFKIVIVCEDSEGNDQTAVRIDRLVNREKISVEQAKEEVLTREKNDIEKWRRMYGKNDPNWVYWDKKYYDLVINTYDHNQEETLKIALNALGYKKM